MPAIAINAADLTVRTNAFVSVKTTQITVSATKTEKADFESFFKNSEKTVQDSNITAESDVKTTDTKAIETEKVQDRAEPTTVSQTAETGQANATVSENETGNLPEDEMSEMTNGVMLKTTLKISVAAVKLSKNLSVVDDEETEELVNKCLDALTALSSMLQRFAQILDVTVDKLEGSFEELNISLEQVITNGSLSDLMMNLGICDNLSQMLCDEGAAQCYEQLKDAVQEMLDTMNMTAQSMKELIADPVFTETAEQTQLVAKGFLPKESQLNVSDAEVKDTQAQESEKPFFTVTVEAKGENESEGSNKDMMSLETGRDEKITKTSDSKETKSHDGFDKFLEGLENAVKISDTQEIPMVDGKFDVREIVFRIVEAIKVNLSPDKTSLELTLNPASLGKIGLEISSKEGVVTAKISTENEITKQAVESQLEVLKESIIQQGIKVEAIEVTVTGFSFADSSNAQKGESEQEEKKVGKTSRPERDGEVGVTNEDQATASQPMPEGSTVNYVA